MINHRACEQLIPFYNNLKTMSLEEAKNSFWKAAMVLNLSDSM